MKIISKSPTIYTIVYFYREPLNNFDSIHFNIFFIICLSIHSEYVHYYVLKGRSSLLFRSFWKHNFVKVHNHSSTLWAQSISERRLKTCHLKNYCPPLRYCNHWKIESNFIELKETVFRSGPCFNASILAQDRDEYK